MEADKRVMTLHVNGEKFEAILPVHKTLLEVLREDFDLTGTKHGCEVGECGTCTVLVDGEPILSCLSLGIEVEGKQVTTVEGLEINGQLHPVQEAFIEFQAAQCGYCTPGMLIASKALLEANSSPTRDEIKEALSGNLCRCTGYWKIIEAVESVASKMSDAKGAA